MKNTETGFSTHPVRAPKEGEKGSRNRPFWKNNSWVFSIQENCQTTGRVNKNKSTGRQSQKDGTGSWKLADRKAETGSDCCGDPMLACLTQFLQVLRGPEPVAFTYILVVNVSQLFLVEKLLTIDYRNSKFIIHPLILAKPKILKVFILLFDSSFVSLCIVSEIWPLMLFLFFTTIIIWEWAEWKECCKHTDVTLSSHLLSGTRRCYLKMLRVVSLQAQLRADLWVAEAVEV